MKNSIIKKFVTILVCFTVITGILPANTFAFKPQTRDITNSVDNQLNISEIQQIEDMPVRPKPAVPELPPPPVYETSNLMGILVEGDFEYTVNDDATTVTIAKYKGVGGSVIIPNVIDGKAVTSIGKSAFSLCTRLTSVKIQNGVTSIGEYAFYDCRGLTSIEIPSSVTSIGKNAFYDCIGLTSIEIPSSVTSIGEYAFYDCRGLTSIEIPNSVTAIGAGAFSDCTGLTSVKMQNGITSIGSSAFSACRGLTSIEIPSSVTSIGKSAFDGCTGLTSIEIPSSVTSIEESAFDGCTGLTSIKIPDSITSIKESAFEGCTGLTSIEIPSSVTSIGYYAFMDCTGLTSVEIPSSVTRINGTFSGCTGLTSVEIPSSVTSIGYEAFRDCRGLTSIEIPSSVTSISESAFSGCTGLTSIEIPNSVASIGRVAFLACTGLTSINIPDSVTYIGGSAFNGCTGLTSVTIPSSVTSINSAFSYCTGLTSIEIPSSVTSISQFDFDGCTGLTSIEIPSSVTSIGNYAFRNCTELTSIEIPSSVISIGESAFRSCTGLTSVKMQNGITSIGEFAFFGCTGLTSIEIPSSVTSIGSAFSGCTGLTSIEIPSSVTSIGKSAFDGCTELTSIEIPSSVTSISYNAFNGCNKLSIRCYVNSYAYEYASRKGIPIEIIKGDSISLSIKNASGTPIVSNYIINWFEKGSDTIISTGNILNNLDINKQYQYEIILDEVTGIVYKQPTRQDLILNGEQKVIDVVLENIESINLTGKIVDSQQRSVEGAKVLIEQTLNSKFNQVLTAVSDSNGNFSATVLKDKTNITISKDNFLDKILNNVDSEFTNPNVDLGSIVITPLKENKVTLNLNKHMAIKDGEDEYNYPISSFANLSFGLKNITQNKDIISFKAQYPYILIDDETIKENDTIEITAKDNLNQMTTTKTTFTLDSELNGTATINFIENGFIEADSISSQNANDLVMLFDSTGNFISNYIITGSKFQSDKLTSGNYTLLFMAKTSLLTKVTNIAKLNEIGLANGSDYISKNITIENGKITTISNINIPKLDETKLYYTKEATLSVNKSTIATGNLLTMRLGYIIDEKYNTNSQTIKVDIPKNMKFIENSVTLDSTLVSYSYTGNTVNIITNKNNGIVRFCMIPLTAGEHITSAFLTFNGDKGTVMQPIGQVTINSTELVLELPKKTGNTQVLASGIAIPHSTVKVLDNNVEVGETQSNANGNWQLAFELVKPSTYSQHEIYAKITNSQGITVNSETKELLYNVAYIDVSKITMIQNNRKVVFDYLNPSATIPNYPFNPWYPTFTFKVEFTNNKTSSLKDVYIVTKDSKGEETYVPVVYDAQNKIWVGIHNYNINNLPYKVGVKFICTDSDNPSNPDNGENSAVLKPVTPIIDPSGYVYEAVPSNRLEGVTTTCYTTTESGENGNNTEVPTVWNALDFDQINPLITDSEGKYAWDVPMGKWQVKYDKAGYETAYSDWLPVPPPQTDINIGMVSTENPKVDSVNCYSDSIEITFDKYMQIETVNTTNVVIKQGDNILKGSIEAINAEASNTDPNLKYATIFYFTPDIALANDINISISNVLNYTGLGLATPYNQTKTVMERPHLVIEANVNVDYNSQKLINISIVPPTAGANKKIKVVSSSPEIASINTNEIILDSNGNSTITVNGNLLGKAELHFELLETNIKHTTKITVSNQKTTVEELEKIIIKSKQALNNKNSTAEEIVEAMQDLAQAMTRLELENQ